MINKNKKYSSNLGGKGEYTEDGTAKHYDEGLFETIVKMERIYGTLFTMVHCEQTSDKYRDRLGKKVGESLEKDVVKIGWYTRKAEELRNKILNTPNQIIFPDKDFIKKFKHSFDGKENIEN